MKRWCVYFKGRLITRCETEDLAREFAEQRYGTIYLTLGVVIVEGD